MKLGFYGGTFNPPHKIHTKIAEIALDKLSLDKIIFIPSKNPPHKDPNMVASAHIRLEMVKLIIKDKPRFEISDIEFRREGKSFSKDTIAQVKNMYPDDEIFWIVGGDALVSMPSWENAFGILDMCKFVVINRKNCSLESVPQDMIEKVILLENDDSHGVSSTQIRELIRQKNPDVLRFIEQEIYEYIQKNELYFRDQN